MMKHMAAVAVMCTTMGCDGGGAPDHASTFTGHWVGRSTIDFAPVTIAPTPGGAIPLMGLAALSPPLDIVSTGLNNVEIGGVCEAFGGLPSDRAVMDVTGPSTLAGRHYACTPSSNHDSACPPTDTVVIDGGSGSLASDGLVVAMTGTLTSCGQAYPFTFSFTGSKR